MNYDMQMLFIFQNMFWNIGVKTLTIILCVNSWKAKKAQTYVLISAVSLEKISKKQMF